MLGQTHQESADKGCFHLGFYEVVGMWAKPNNVYICSLYLPTLMNYVSVWVQNTAYWGQPLITCRNKRFMV
jgi:hypothetical protein